MSVAVARRRVPGEHRVYSPLVLLRQHDRLRREILQQVVDAAGARDGDHVGTYT